jgi:hypothetical protein
LFPREISVQNLGLDLGLSRNFGEDIRISRVSDWKAALITKKTEKIYSLEYSLI